MILGFILPSKQITLLLGGNSTDDRWASSELRCSTHYKRKQTFSFHIMVRESKNNAEHLRFSGAQSGIFLSCHSSFGRSRVWAFMVLTLNLDSRKVCLTGDGFHHNSGFWKKLPTPGNLYSRFFFCIGNFFFVTWYPKCLLLF